MRKLGYIILAITVVLGMVGSAMAADLAAEPAGKPKVEQKWVDITEKILANPSDKGGWTEDPKGKIYRSEDGNWIKVVHSSFGTYLVDLAGKKTFQVDGDKQTMLEDAELMQRDFGTSLVIKTKTYKFRLKFKEQVSGMKHIEGIRGM